MHSVRFDDETEVALTLVCDATGETPSEVLKRGVLTLAKLLGRKPAARPYEIYRKLELGPGGYARGPAREAKRVIRLILQEKHRRRR